MGLHSGKPQKEVYISVDARERLVEEERSESSQTARRRVSKLVAELAAEAAALEESGAGGWQPTEADVNGLNKVFAAVPGRLAAQCHFAALGKMAQEQPHALQREAALMGPAFLSTVLGIDHGTETETLVITAASQVASYMQAERAVLYLVRRNAAAGTDASLVTFVGHFPTAAPCRVTVPASVGVPGEVLRTRRALNLQAGLAEDEAALDTLYDAAIDKAARFGLRSLLAVPVFRCAGGELVGVLQVVNKNRQWPRPQQEQPQQQRKKDDESTAPPPAPPTTKPPVVAAQQQPPLPPQPIAIKPETTPPPPPPPPPPQRSTPTPTHAADAAGEESATPSEASGDDAAQGMFTAVPPPPTSPSPPPQAEKAAVTSSEAAAAATSASAAVPLSAFDDSTDDELPASTGVAGEEGDEETTAAHVPVRDENDDVEASETTGVCVAEGTAAAAAEDEPEEECCHGETEVPRGEPPRRDFTAADQELLAALATVISSFLCERNNLQHLHS